MKTFQADLVYKLLLVITVGGCLIQSYRIHYSLPSSDNLPSRDGLHDLMRMLIIKGGFKGRAVSDRQDGLMVEAVFLTQAKKDDNEIRSLLAGHSSSRWRGTVKIIYDPNPDRHFSEINGSEFHYGPFLFFGDSELIGAIAEILWSLAFR
jgi:hypothetical protein